MSRKTKQTHGAFGFEKEKKKNDTSGHAEGDKYIKKACSMICGVFAHSPVFRIGGDEFVTVLMRSDYEKKEELYSLLKRTVSEKGPAVAAGMVTYIPGRDKTVGDTFRRADAKMYENKRAMKNAG